MRNVFVVGTLSGLLVCGFDVAGVLPNHKTVFPDFDARANAVKRQAAVAPAHTAAEQG
jgi:hypothetical protein